MFSRFGRTYLSVKVPRRMQHRFHIEAHCFSLNQLHGSAPVRCYLPYRERAVRVQRLRSRVSSVLLGEPPCLRVCTNELGDPRSEPGNWNVRIKLAARPSRPPLLPPVLSCPSPSPRIYRSRPRRSLLPLPFALGPSRVPPFATALSLSPTAAISASGAEGTHRHRSADRSFN